MPHTVKTNSVKTSPAKTPAAEPGAATPAPPGAETPAGPRPRGRPRDLRARDAILQAARELLDAQGPAGVTMEAVAARAGVGKPTVYRWWPDRHAVAMAALMAAETPEGEAATPLARRPRSPLQALQQQLLAVAQTLSSRTGRNVTAMIAAADPDTQVAKAFRHQFVLARRAEGRDWLLQAVQHGEVRGDLDVDVALDLIYGALFFRVLLGHAPVDAAFARQLVREFTRGLQPAG
jgi:AcrR family transcriptional regulator